MVSHLCEKESIDIYTFDKQNQWPTPNDTINAVNRQ